MRLTSLQITFSEHSDTSTLFKNVSKNELFGVFLSIANSLLSFPIHLKEIKKKKTEGLDFSVCVTRGIPESLRWKAASERPMVDSFVCILLCMTKCIRHVGSERICIRESRRC